MSKRNFVVVAAGLAALLVVGGLYASNMGFKLNYPLDNKGTNGSAEGIQPLAFPYYQQTSLVKASDVRADVEATVAGAFGRLDRFVKSTNALESYTGAAGGVNFDITPGEGYYIFVKQPVNYIIVGSHNPGLVTNLDAPDTNGSADGFQLWAFPYHGTAVNASGLRAEINLTVAGAVDSISHYVRTTNAQETYTGGAGSTDFPMVPGESYLIKVNQDVPYVPSHY